MLMILLVIILIFEMKSHEQSTFFGGVNTESALIPKVLHMTSESIHSSPDTWNLGFF